jgi:phospholipid/cholesterol/gamma-HCH transport system substrate-binding protein
MTEGGRNFFVGAVSILGLLGIVLLLILFGEVDRFVQPRYAVTIVINDAGGLVEGSPVTLNGVPVGIVDRVVLERDAEKPVRVVAVIDEHVEIPKPATASVLVSMLGGRSTLLLDAEFGPNIIEYFARDGTATIHGTYKPMLEEFSAAMERQMQPIFDAFDDFSEFAKAYSELGRNLNDIVRPGEGEDNIRVVMTRLSNTLDQVAEAVELVKGWLGDEQLKTDAREAVASAKELMTRASDAMDQFTTLAANLDTRTEDVAGRLVVVSDELADLLEDVNGLVDHTKQGEGTLGKLITNPDLYNSLQDAAVRLEQALREAQLLIQKLREEGVNIKL